MYNIDYDALVKTAPEFYKFLLNKIEEKILLGDAEAIYSALNNYQRFKEVLSNNNIFYKEFEIVYESLEKKVVEFPEPIKTFNQRVIEDYNLNSNLQD